VRSEFGTPIPEFRLSVNFGKFYFSMGCFSSYELRPDDMNLINLKSTNTHAPGVIRTHNNMNGYSAPLAHSATKVGPDFWNSEVPTFEIRESRFLFRNSEHP